MKNLEFNKIFASILLTGISILAISNFVDIIYHPSDAGNHAYSINASHTSNTSSHTSNTSNMSSNASTATGALKTSDINALDLGSLLASGDIGRGEKISKKCIACHTFNKGGHNKVGPNLWDIVGKQKGHLGDKFAYSKGLLAQGGVWDYEALLNFLYKPSQYIKGTKMSFIGITNQQQLADIILYLHSLSDNPIPLPEKKSGNNGDNKE